MAKGKKSNKKLELANQAPNPRLVCLEIDQISLYDRNPRTTRNPEYERIKRSIVDHGLEQPLIVTRRPGDKAYMVKAGGNTRLQILKDLYAESKDPCYAMVTCIEVGWEDESDVLVGHLRENSLRGNLTFIDKAAAVCAYADMMAEAQNGAMPKIRDLQSALLKQGYPISTTLLSYMRYAAEFLMPAIPVALSDGLGWHAIRRIRQLHRTGSQLWSRYSIGSDSEFDDTFSELCRRHDGPDWQIEPLRHALATEIAEAADISLQTIRMAIDAPDIDSTEVTESYKADPAAGQDGDGAPDMNDLTEPARDSTSTGTTVAAPESLTVEIDLDDEPNDGNGTSSKHQDRKQHDPFLDLRRRAFGLADSLARRFGMADLVAPLPDCGHGFLTIDVPDRSLLDAADARSRAAMGTLWWQLLAFSETASAPASIIEERLPNASALRRILLDQELELLFDRVQIIEAAYFAEEFWARLPKQDWQDWLYLAHTHREIRSKVIELEQPLWNAAS
jgi:ParB family protein of integrating conjugative element (PFGI_1 class)